MSIKSFIQRGRRGYADKDLVCFDTYLAQVISSAMFDFVDQGLALPGNFGASFEYPMSKSHEQLKEEAWSAIISDIAAGFKEYSKTANPSGNFLDSMHLFCQYYHWLWL